MTSPATSPPTPPAPPAPPAPRRLEYWRHRVFSDHSDIRHAVRFAAGHFMHSQLPVMAAALSYRTIFGLIPVIVIGLVVLGGFATEEQIADTVRTMLKYSGLSDITVDQAEEVGPPRPSADLDPFGGGPQADTAAPPPAVNAAPTPHGQRVDQWIGDMVQNVRKIPLRTIGLVGLLALIYAAISMLVEIEQAFNHIYLAPAGRSWGARVARYWTMLTLGTIFLVLTFVVTERVNNWVFNVALSQGEGTRAGWFSWAQVIAGYLLTVPVSTALLLVLYILIPNTVVKLRPALVGAFIAALLWEAGKWGFAKYLRESASSSYGRLYGSIALLPLFMLWVYLTWLIVLFGLYISYSLQTFKEHPLTKAISRPPSIVDPASILIVLGSVAERFNLGKTSDPADVAAATGLDPEVVTSMLERLTQAGILHRVNPSAERVGFTLAKPPGAIQATEVLAIGNDLAGKPDKDRAPASLAQVVSLVRSARLAVADGKSLADLLPAAKPATPLAAPDKPG